MNRTNNLSNERLASELLDAFTHEKQGQRVDALKNELYQRGYKRADIIKIAIASIIRSRRNR